MPRDKISIFKGTVHPISGVIQYVVQSKFLVCCLSLRVSPVMDW